MLKGILGPIGRLQPKKGMLGPEGYSSPAWASWPENKSLSQKDNFVLKGLSWPKSIFLHQKGILAQMGSLDAKAYKPEWVF